jgi:hypothetical protein
MIAALTIASGCVGCGESAPLDEADSEDELVAGEADKGEELSIQGVALIYTEVPMEAQRAELRCRIRLANGASNTSAIDRFVFSLTLDSGGVPGGFASTRLEGSLGKSTRSTFTRTDRDQRYSIEGAAMVPSDATRTVLRKAAGQSIDVRFGLTCTNAGCLVAASGVFYANHRQNDARPDLRFTAEGPFIVRPIETG